jgi:ribosomal 50S subunit-recycling heat shock protein
VGSGQPQAWDELSAGEVQALLHLRRDQGLPALSAWLDVHQWLPLTECAGFTVAGPHGESQFRRVGLDLAPGWELWRLTLADLAPGLRGARALRRWLQAGATDLPAVGDLAPDESGGMTFAALPDWQPPADLRLKAAAAWPAVPPPQQASVASLRADAVVAACFRISRSEASAALEHGYVFVNFQPVNKAARHVASGDQLVLRGRGRAELVNVRQNERSGRQRLEFRSFPC